MSWRPTASIEVLQARSDLLRRVRGFFEEKRFCEVQTPALSRDTVVDRHLDPIEVPGTFITLPEYSGADPSPFYLQTSPEFAMKRLLAAGMTAIYQISSVFRASERGQFHNPEFTMVEWYRVGDDFIQGVQLLSELVQAVTHFSAPELVTYQAAFVTHTDCDPLQASVPLLAELGTSRLHTQPTWSQDKDDWLNLLFSELVQPRLGWERPIIVTNYPASQSALARLTESSSSAAPTAERFELFIRGVELANGYHELTDASVLEQRNAVVNRQRVADGKSALPARSSLLDAMRAGLPDCSGCALGLDRLLMVQLHLESIDQVIPFPIERS